MYFARAQELWVSVAVETDRVMPHARRSGPGVAHGDVFPLQHFRSTWLVDSNCLWHELLLDYQ